jgi:hypothetical protein
MRGDPRTTRIQTACRFVLRRAQRSGEGNLPRRGTTGITFASDPWIRLLPQQVKVLQMVPNYGRLEEEFDPLAGAFKMARRRESKERAAFVQCAPEAAGECASKWRAPVGQRIERRDHGIEPDAVVGDTEDVVAGERRREQGWSPLV